MPCTIWPVGNANTPNQTSNFSFKWPIQQMNRFESSREVDSTGVWGVNVLDSTGVNVLDSTGVWGVNVLDSTGVIVLLACEGVD